MEDVKVELATLKETAIDAEANVESLQADVKALEAADEVDKEAVKEAKAKVREAEAAMKKANAAVTKEEKRLAREQEKAERQAKKEAEKAERQAKREQAKKEREEEAARKKAEREANRMPEQNGIRRPKPDTKCGRTWEIADTMSAEMGQPVPIAMLIEACNKEGLNEGNTKAEYARWRKFNDITGRITAPKDEEPATEEPAA